MAAATAVGGRARAAAVTSTVIAAASVITATVTTASGPASIAAVKSTGAAVVRAEAASAQHRREIELAAAEGDLDGNGSFSTFSRAGSLVNGQVRLATEVYVKDEFE